MRIILGTSTRSGCRLGAAHTLRADRGRMAGTGLDLEDIAGTQADIAVVGVEHNASVQADERLVVAVLMPPVALPRPVRPRPKIKPPGFQHALHLIGAAPLARKMPRSHAPHPRPKAPTPALVADTGPGISRNFERIGVRPRGGKL